MGIPDCYNDPSEMRDKIIQIIDAACASPDFDLEGNGRWADRILALITKPTGLVKVSKCTECNGTGKIKAFTSDKKVFWPEVSCTCEDGFIRTDLTADEAVDLWHKYLDRDKCNEYLVHTERVDGKWKWRLVCPDDSRIELEEKK